MTGGRISTTYRRRVDELDRGIVSTMAAEVGERFPEFGRAWAKRTKSGQLVVQFDSRWVAVHSDHSVSSPSIVADWSWSLP